MKRIRKVKWENIVTIVTTIIAIQRLLLIIDNKGVSQDTTIEIAFYSLAVIGARYLIKDLRINPTNWLIEK
jgi:hypothetical protein